MLVFDPKPKYHTPRNSISWIKTTPETEEQLISRAQSLGINCVNIGFQIASFLNTAPRNKYLAIDTKEQLDRILIQARQEAISAGQHTVGLYNLGILVEPELGLDAGQIIKNHGRDGAIVLFWGGLSDGAHTLSWTVGNANAKFHFPGVTLHQIILPHEVS